MTEVGPPPPPVDTPPIFAVPGPVPATVATPGVALLQAPPVVASTSAAVEPMHTVNVPVIGAGVTSTVIVVDTVQPVGAV